MPEVTSNIFRGGMMIVGSMAIIGLIDNFIRFVAMEAGVWQFYFRAGFGSSSTHHWL